MSDGDTSLALISEARRALAEARTLPDLRRVMEVAKLAEGAARAASKLLAGRLAADVAKAANDAANDAAGIRLEAQAKAGELLAVMPKNRGAEGIGTAEVQSHAVTAPPTLADLGIDRMSSSRWQHIAEVAEPIRTEYVESVKAAGGEVTTVGLVRYAASLREPEPAVTPPLPDGQYRCIVIDPPWPMAKIGRDERPLQGDALDYPSLPILCQDRGFPLESGGTPTTCRQRREWSREDDEGLPSLCQSIECVVGDAIAATAHDGGCHVYLWTTHRFLPAALDLFEAWDVEYQCPLTWVKNVGFTPFSWMYDTEHVLFGRVGSLQLEQLGLRLSFSAPVTRHSAKPDVFYERVRAASPGPRLEMFSRTEREGFTAWGNEIADPAS